MTSPQQDDSSGSAANGGELPEPTNPDFIRMMAIYQADADRARAEKAESIARLSELASDEEILNDIGLDMSVLRQDPDAGPQ